MLSERARDERAIYGSAVGVGADGGASVASYRGNADAESIAALERY